MKTIYIVLIVCMASLISPAIVGAQELAYGVQANGGDEINSAGHTMLGTVGQAAIGEVMSTGYIHGAGYWFWPGPNVGEPTGSHFSGLTAERREASVVVRWEVANVADAGDFHVWRQVADLDRVLLNAEPIEAGPAFEYVDAAAPVEEIEYWIQERRGSEHVVWFGPITVPELPLTFKLDPNRPNPFNPSTNLHFSLPEPGRVRLAVYDMRGQLVKTLIDGPQPRGLFTVPWYGRDDQGSEVSSGVYIARLESDEGVQIRKMLLAK